MDKKSKYLLDGYGKPWPCEDCGKLIKSGEDWFYNEAVGYGTCRICSNLKPKALYRRVEHFRVKKLLRGGLRKLLKDLRA